MPEQNSWLKGKNKISCLPTLLTTALSRILHSNKLLSYSQLWAPQTRTYLSLAQTFTSLPSMQHFLETNLPSLFSSTSPQIYIRNLFVTFQAVCIDMKYRRKFSNIDFMSVVLPIGGVSSSTEPAFSLIQHKMVAIFSPIPDVHLTAVRDGWKAILLAYISESQ